MTLVEYLRRHEVRLAGLLGITGMTIGVLADIASGYSLSGASNITTAFSVLSLANISGFLLSKPPTEVVVGHYLAVVGIPLGLFGLWQVYRAIKPAGWLFSRTVWILGVFGYVLGTVFHSTFAFVTFGVQESATTSLEAEQSTQTMLGQFAVVFEPLGLLLVGVMGVTFGLIFVTIAFRETQYPRWFAFANPLLIQAVTGAIALVSPLEVRIFFVVTAYNLSLAVFYFLSTAVLWDQSFDTQPAFESKLP